MAKKKKASVATTKTGVVSFRCTERVAGLLDERVLELRKQHPGRSWTRASAAGDIVAKELLGGEVS